MKIIIFGCALICAFSACDRNHCPDHLTYELPFTLINPSDTISVGDTLWYKSEFGKVLYDKNGNIENTFEDYDFSFLFLYLTKIDSTEEQLGGILIDTINVIGSLGYFTVSAGYEFYPLNYKYDPITGYSIEIGLIVKEPGLFSVQFAYHDENKEVPINCTQKSVDWYLTLNEAGNFEMLQSSPISFWQTYLRSDWDRYGSFCVYVKP